MAALLIQNLIRELFRLCSGVLIHRLCYQSDDVCEAADAIATAFEKRVVSKLLVEVASHMITESVLIGHIIGGDGDDFIGNFEANLEYQPNSLSYCEMRGEARREPSPKARSSSASRCFGSASKLTFMQSTKVCRNRFHVLEVTCSNRHDTKSLGIHSSLTDPLSGKIHQVAGLGYREGPKPAIVQKYTHCELAGTLCVRMVTPTLDIDNLVICQRDFRTTGDVAHACDA